MRRPRPLTLVIVAEVVGCVLLAALALAAVFTPAPSVPLVTLMPTPALSTVEGLTPSAIPSTAPTAESTQVAVAASDTPLPPAVETATPIVLPTPALSTPEHTPKDEGAPLLPKETPTQTSPVLIASDTPAEILPTVPSRTPRPDTPTPTQTPIPTATLTPTQTPTQTLTPTPTAPPVPAYISGLTANAREIFLRGQSLGNRAHAFALVGDSNTDNPAFFAPFDFGSYNLGEHGYLQGTLNYFGGSFARDSVAAVGGFSTAKVLDPAFNDPAWCSSSESPLACEYRLQRPSIALILLGTGDHQIWQGFRGRYRQVVEYTLAQGIIPVLITKADDLESLEDGAPAGYINGVIVQMSGDYRVPLLDLRQAVAPLPNRGLLPDGFHYNYPGDGQFANFADGYLDYGFNMRNLTGLQVLDVLRRQVMYDAP
ncbi:MAG: hypothetical protein A2W37_09630 [Chloroflexi bacterium RBG_16_63_12]|nr:MAG: hypothetical protein A2W37_09630 [Chloroflexi bacterium RBG_16_63_12]